MEQCIVRMPPWRPRCFFCTSLCTAISKGGGSNLRLAFATFTSLPNVLPDAMFSAGKISGSRAKYPLMQARRLLKCYDHDGDEPVKFSTGCNIGTIIVTCRPVEVPTLQ